MSWKTIKIFETSDGKIFKNKKDGLCHECVLEINQVICKAREILSDIPIELSQKIMDHINRSKTFQEYFNE